ncbi:MAG TPA: EamA/RhaT family transporter [Thermoplasmatales archaeon]|nr:EamA/RhaT family transporter [Thermoplasmatales archaeon]
MVDEKRAYAYAIASVLMWATVASAFKITLRYMEPFHLLFFSCMVATIILFFILLASHHFHGIWHRKAIPRSILLGFLNPFLYYNVLFLAYDLLPAQEAMTLNYMWPIVLTLLSIPLLKQKVGIKNIAALFISFFGVIIISTHGNPLSFKFSNPVGVFLALASTIIWAIFWIFNVRDKRDETVKLFLNFFFGMIFVTIAAIFIGIKIPNIYAMMGATYTGIFEMALAFTLWLKALQLAPQTAKVSNLIYLTPFLSMLCIYFFVGEKILPSTFIGLLFIISGILLQQWKGNSIT